MSVEKVSSWNTLNQACAELGLRPPHVKGGKSIVSRRRADGRRTAAGFEIQLKLEITLPLWTDRSNQHYKPLVAGPNNHGYWVAALKMAKLSDVEYPDIVKLGYQWMRTRRFDLKTYTSQESSSCSSSVDDKHIETMKTTMNNAMAQSIVRAWQKHLDEFRVLQKLETKENLAQECMTKWEQSLTFNITMTMDLSEFLGWGINERDPALAIDWIPSENVITLSNLSGHVCRLTVTSSTATTCHVQSSLSKLKIDPASIPLPPDDDDDLSMEAGTNKVAIAANPTTPRSMADILEDVWLSILEKFATTGKLFTANVGLHTYLTEMTVHRLEHSLLQSLTLIQDMKQYFPHWDPATISLVHISRYLFSSEMTAMRSIAHFPALVGSCLRFYQPYFHDKYD